MKQRHFGLIAAGLLLLSACTNTADSANGTTESRAPVELTFRLWDEGAAEAYEESFEAFTARNPHIRVAIELVDIGDYQDALGEGDLPDVFWADYTTLIDGVDRDQLIPIESSNNWSQTFAKLFTVDDTLYAVPQLWNSTALYYNKDLYEGQEVSVNKLEWAPDGGDSDTLLDVARSLTVDAEGNHPTDEDFDSDEIETYGFAVDYDLHSTFVPFLLQSGGALQDSEGTFSFDTEQGHQSAQYLVDLPEKHEVSPPATEAFNDPKHNEDLFTDGRLALYQSDSSRIADIAEHSSFSWGIAPLVAGPEGEFAVVDGIGAAGNANSEHPEESALLLDWLGTGTGQEYLGSHGVGFPATSSGQDTYVNYWAKQGIDVSAFIESTLNGVPITAHGHNIAPALETMEPIVTSMLAGDIPVKTALQEAQEAGNEALGR